LLKKTDDKRQKNMRTFHVTALFIVFIFTLTACSEKGNEAETAGVTFSERRASRRVYWPLEYYPHYETLFFESGKGYEIKNENSNKLLITLGGMGWRSAIGRPGERTGSRSMDIVLPLHEEYNFFVPEKFDREVGRYYLYDANAREQYTIDNLLAVYAGVINGYLSRNDYETIIIAGFSEGALLLPELYFLLNEPDKITALIPYAGGGLSLFEYYEVIWKKLLAEEPPFKEPYIDNIASRIGGLEQVFNIYMEEPYPDSSERDGDATYRWLTSFLFRRPFDFYVDIEIPVLFIHGEMDINVPVESTRYVEKNLPDKPFDYIYYPEMEHLPLLEELMILREDIKGWLREKGL